MITYFHISESTDASWNLAFEEYLLRNVRDGEIFLLWRNDRSVILGKNQVAAAEVDLGFARENGIRVYHRITGGGAVYHDLGNVNFSRIVDYDPESPPRLADLLSPIVNALRQMGLPAVTSSRNDLLVDGKKICGTAYAIDKGHAARTAGSSLLSVSSNSQILSRDDMEHPKNDRLLVHGCLLFSVDLTLLSRVLTPPPEKLARHGIPSVRSRVARIADYLPGLSVEDFMGRLAASIREGREVVPLAGRVGSKIDAL